MMRRTHIACLAIILTAVISACSLEAPDGHPGPGHSPVKAAARLDAASAPAPDKLVDPARAGWGAQRLIRSGSMELETMNVSQAAHQAMQAVETLGGHLADSDLTRLPEAPASASLVLRVPAARYFDLLDALRSLGDVRAERTSTEDITRAHADLEARLRVRRRAEARLIEMLQHRTEDLGDVLRVETELERVLEEIERLEGERRYFEQQTAFSSLSVILREPQPLVAGSPLALLQEALRESLGLLGTSALLLARLVAFLLPWLALGGLAWLVGQRLPRRA